MARWAPLRIDVLDEYAEEVLQVFPRGRLLVGIDGLDGAGKTTFARDLVEAFVRRDVPAAALSTDDFHTERAVRHQPPDDAQVWYEHGYDHEALRRVAIEPYRRGEPVALAFRSRADDAVLPDPPRFEPTDRAVLVVEGVFLHRPELVGLWHTSAWLEVPWETAVQRCVDRDGFDPAPEAVLRRQFFGAEEIYLRRVDPRKRAVATFDLREPVHPRRVFSDSC